jgi:hypothetical protein
MKKHQKSRPFLCKINKKSPLFEGVATGRDFIGRLLNKKAWELDRPTPCEWYYKKVQRSIS